MSDYLNGQTINDKEVSNATSFQKWSRHFVRNLGKIEFNETFLEKYRNPSEKFAFFADENNLIELNELCKCENKQLKEVLFRYPMGIEIHNAPFIFEIVEETLQLIIPFGIPQHSVNIHRWKWHKKFDAEPKRPQVFTLDSLSFGFVLWLSSCGISFLWFLAEFLSRWLKKQLKPLIGLILFLMLLYCRLNTCAYL